MNLDPILAPGNLAIITGAASGIGRAAAHAFAAKGMTLLIADLPGDALENVARELGCRAQATDVSDPAQIARLAQIANEIGPVSILMNNAGSGANPGPAWQNPDGFRKLIDINFFSAVYGTSAFAPAMIAHAKPGLIINTGSKQGITTPPGNPAYNVSKAALKAYTEALAHDLRAANAKITAHLLIPGFTFTGMTGAGEKPPAAWTPEQVIAFMLDSLARDDFYILCPDNDVPRATDERRMQWAIDDIIKNRPALSRWHPDYKAAFETFMKR